MTFTVNSSTTIASRAASTFNRVDDAYSQRRRIVGRQGAIIAVEQSIIVFVERFFAIASLQNPNYVVT